MDQSFGTRLKMRNVNGVAHAGNLLRQVLDLVGARGRALEVLNVAARAFDALQQPGRTREIRQLISQIKEKTP